MATRRKKIGRPKGSKNKVSAVRKKRSTKQLATVEAAIKPVRKKKRATKSRARKAVVTMGELQKSIWEVLDVAESRMGAADAYAKVAMECVNQVLKLTQRIAEAESNQSFLLSQMHRLYSMTDEEKRVREEADGDTRLQEVAALSKVTKPRRRTAKKSASGNESIGGGEMPAEMVAILDRADAAQEEARGRD